MNEILSDKIVKLTGSKVQDRLNGFTGSADVQRRRLSRTVRGVRRSGTGPAGAPLRFTLPRSPPPCPIHPERSIKPTCLLPCADTELRQCGPLGERLTDSELEPIRVHAEGGPWLVDYGSYVQGHHGSEEAIGAATTAVLRENRE